MPDSNTIGLAIWGIGGGLAAGWTLRSIWRSRRPCRACLERAEAETALEAIRREPETLERLKGLKVDPAAIKARVTAAGCALRAAGLAEEFYVGDRSVLRGGLGWTKKEAEYRFFTWSNDGAFSDEVACLWLPAFLAEAEKRLRARNADLRRAGIDAP